MQAIFQLMMHLPHSAHTRIAGQQYPHDILNVILIFMCLVVKGCEHFSFRFWPFVPLCLKMDVQFICSFTNEDICSLAFVLFFMFWILNLLSIVGIYFSSWDIENRILSDFFHIEFISAYICISFYKYILYALQLS